MWLEEATAQQASELYGRAIHGNGWKTNAGYQDALFCEVRPSSASCNGATFVMGNHFGFLNDYLQNFETKSILSGIDDYDLYGSSSLSSIKGGGAMLLRINASGNAGSQLLDLHDFSGQPLDPTSNIGIAVLRIQ